MDLFVFDGTNEMLQRGIPISPNDPVVIEGIQHGIVNDCPVTWEAIRELGLGEPDDMEEIVRASAFSHSVIAIKNLPRTTPSRFLITACEASQSKVSARLDVSGFSLLKAEGMQKHWWMGTTGSELSNGFLGGPDLSRLKLASRLTFRAGDAAVVCVGNSLECACGMFVTRVLSPSVVEAEMTFTGSVPHVLKGVSLFSQGTIEFEGVTACFRSLVGKVIELDD